MKPVRRKATPAKLKRGEEAREEQVAEEEEEQEDGSEGKGFV